MKQLPGIIPLAFRAGRQCTFVGALEALVRYYGGAWDYVDLMGLSGTAFRMRVARSTSQEIMGGRLHAGVSTDASCAPYARPLMEVAGFSHTVLHRFPRGDRPTAEAIRNEIDEGRPLLALNLHNGSSWGVVCGYDPSVALIDDEERGNAQALICRSYYDTDTSQYQQPTLFPADVWTLTKTRKSMPFDEALPDALLRAVNCLESHPARIEQPGGWFWHYEPEAANGKSAYDAWIEDLDDEAGIAALPPDQFVMYWQGNAFMYDQLIDARRAAATFLDRLAPHFESSPRLDLQLASKVFLEQSQALIAAWRCFPFRKGGYRHHNGWNQIELQEQLDGVNVPPYAEDWGRDERAAGIDALRKAKERDQTAAGLLRSALEHGVARC